MAALAFTTVISVSPAHALTLRHEGTNPRSSLALVHHGGSTEVSFNGYEGRPALSLSKLYLGYWVLYHGAPHHKAMVEQMIRYSDDNIATMLDRAYPQAIDAIAHDFGLRATRRNGHWGNASTSAADAARFVNAIRTDPVAAPIMRGMEHAAPVAADGFPQNYGTSRLPGVQGTKFGWSDDRRSATGTVSYGPGFAVSVLTYGDAAANTADALYGILPTPEPVHVAVAMPAGPAVAVRVVDLLPPQVPQALRVLIPRNWVVRLRLPLL